MVTVRLTAQAVLDTFVDRKRYAEQGARLGTLYYASGHDTGPASQCFILEAAVIDTTQQRGKEGPSRG